MSLGKICAKITREIHAVARNLSPDQKDEIARLVRQGMAEASNRAHDEYAEIAREMFGADMDTAHKLQRRMEQKRDLLIANLTAMR